MTAQNMTPVMRDILSLAEGDPIYGCPRSVGVSNSVVDDLAKLGWIVATPRGDRVYVQLTDAGRAMLSITRAI